jgi:hypothetical protein
LYQSGLVGLELAVVHTALLMLLIVYHEDDLIEREFIYDVYYNLIVTI